MSGGGIQANETIVKAATTLSVIEMVLGAFVHGLRLPIGGQLLSLNQGFFLTRVVRDLRFSPDARQSPLYVSSISAVLKSLSPAGNKLGPMLSISMQGFLFAVGPALVGVNVFGICIGMALLSLWAFIQPLFTLYLFFGAGLIQAGIFALEKFQKTWGVSSEKLILFFFAAVIFKMVLAVVLGAWAYLGQSKRLAQYEEQLEALARQHNSSLSKPQKGLSRWRRVELTLRDLLRPFFIFSLALVAVFLYFSESSWSQTIWLLLRPVALGFVFYYLSRSPRFSKLVVWLRRKRSMERFMALFDKTVERLQQVK